MKAFVALVGALLLALPSVAHAEDFPATCADAANAGQPLRRAGKLRAAREQFLLCARDECPENIRSRCAPWLRDVDAALPSVVVRAQDRRGADIVDLRVSIDGNVESNTAGLAITLDPGPHQLRCETPSGEAHEQSIVVAQGEKSRVVLVTFPGPTSADPASPPPAVVAAPRQALVARPVAIGIGAVGIVALGAFAFFEVKAHGGHDDLETGCGTTQTCSPSELDDVRRNSTVAVVAGGIAVAALATSAILLLWHPAGSARASSTGLTGRF